MASGLSGAASNGDVQQVLQQLQAVREQLEGIHDAHKRMEDTLGSRLLEVLGHVKGGSSERVEQAVERCFRRFSPALAAGPGRSVMHFGKGGAESEAPTVEVLPLPSSRGKGGGGWMSNMARRSLSLPSSAGGDARGFPLRAQYRGVRRHVLEEDDGGGNPMMEVPSRRSASVRSLRVTEQYTINSTETGVVVRDAPSILPRSAVGTSDAPELDSQNLRQLPQSMSQVVLPRDEQGLLPLHPNTLPVRAYDLVIFILMIFDLLMIPYQVAFNIDMVQSVFFEVVTYVSFCCWSLDLLAGFAIGRYIRGELVRDSKLLALQYIRREFMLNLVPLVLDIIFIVVLTHCPDVRKSDSIWLLKLGRLVRIFGKFVGTGRSVNLGDAIVTAFKSRKVAAKIPALLLLLWALILIFVVNHLGACAWRLVGSQSVSDGLVQFGLPDGRESEYFVAYYNSVRLIVTGESITDPSGVKEIVGTIIGIYFGLVFVSVLVSSVATHLVGIHIANKETLDKVRLLRKFLQQRQVDPRVAIPVEKQVHERLKSVKMLSEKDVEVLTVVSPSLRVELLASVYGDIVRLLPLFQACGTMDVGYIKDMCYSALKPNVFDPGYRVFEPAQEAVGAHYVSWGFCEYSMPSNRQAAGSSLEDITPQFSGNEQQEVKSGTWISEVAMWLVWKHPGCLECSKACEILSLQACSLIKVLKDRPKFARITQDYMNAVVEAVAREPEEQLSDLHMCVDHETVITSMPLETRRQLSQAALSVLNGGGKFMRPFGGVGGFRELSKEVKEGVCDLIMGRDNRVQRVVNVACLRLVREDNRILVRVGEKKAHTIVPELVLPGTKVRGGELPADALRRFLNNQMRDFAYNTSIGLREVVVEERPSLTYGVDTKYMRTIFHAELGGGSASYALRKIAVKKGLSLKVKSMQSTRQRIPFLVNKYDVFFVAGDGPNRGSSTICAWMDQQEFDDLTNSNMGEAAARSWISALRLEDGELA